MSRTHKDRPGHVRELEQAKKGKVEHDHTGFYESRNFYRKRLRYGVRVGKKVFGERFFMAHEGRELKEYRDLLVSFGILFEEESCERESEGFFRLAGSFLEHHYGKTHAGTEIRPYIILNGPGYTDACTEVSDLRRVGFHWVDSSDGQYAVCSPVYISDRRVPKSQKRANAVSRTLAKQAGWKATKAHRSGTMDEGFDDPSLYCLEMSSGLFCRCCY